MIIREGILAILICTPSQANHRQNAYSLDSIPKKKEKGTCKILVVYIAHILEDSNRSSLGYLGESLAEQGRSSILE
ncbi:unnamed protein product [Victoria cruziana]